MLDVKYEQYKHLENICNIQQRYINNEINGRQMLEDLDSENLRYLNLLKQQNEQLEEEVLSKNFSNNTNNIIIFPKGENNAED